MVANFEGKTATSGLEEGLAAAIRSDLRQYLSTLLTARDRTDPELSEIEAVHIACELNSHAEAREIGRAWHADLVLWGKVEDKVDVAGKNLSRIFLRGLQASNASRNTIQTGANSSVQIDAQQTLNIQLSSDLAGVSLKSCMTLVRWYGSAVEASRNLEISHAQIPSELDFPMLGTQWPLALFHVLLGIYAAHEEHFDLAARQFEEAQEQISIPELHWLTATNRMLAGWLPAGRAAFEQGRKLCPGTAPLCTAFALANLAWGYNQQSEDQKAVELFQQSLLLRKLTEPSDGTIETLASLGKIYDERGAPESTPVFQQLAAQLAQAKEISARIHAGIHLARFQTNRGELQQALTLYDQALALSKKSFDEVGQIVALNNKGVIYEEQQQLKAARDAYSAALEISAQAGHFTGQATIFGNLGRVSLALEDSARAKTAFEHAAHQLMRSLHQRNKAHDLRGKTSTLHRLSSLFADSGELPRALDVADQALELSRKIGDRRAEAISLQLAARARLRLRQGRQALELVKAALALSPESDKTPARILLLKDLGDCHASLREWQQAEGAYEQAQKLCELSGYQLPLLKVLSSMAQVKESAESAQNQLSLYAKIQQLAQERGDISSRVDALLAAARLHAAAGKRIEALKTAHQAVLVARQSEDLPALFLALNSMARLYLSFGAKQFALESYEQILELSRKQQDAARKAAALSMTGWLRCALGQVQAGLSELAQARSEGVHLGPSWTRTLWLSEAGCLLGLGQTEAAKEALKKAYLLPQLPLFGDTLPGDATGLREAEAGLSKDLEQHPRSISALWEASLLAQLGDVYARQHETELAKANYLASLSLSAQLAEPLREVETRERLARLLAWQGDNARANDERQRVLAFYTRVGDTTRMSNFLLALGRLCLDSKQTEQTLHRYAEALAFAKDGGLLELQANVLTEIGKVYADRRAFDAALDKYEAAISLYKKLGAVERQQAVQVLINELPSPKKIEFFP